MNIRKAVKRRRDSKAVKKPCMTYWFKPIAEKFGRKEFLFSEDFYLRYRELRCRECAICHLGLDKKAYNFKKDGRSLVPIGRVLVPIGYKKGKTLQKFTFGDGFLYSYHLLLMSEHRITESET